MISGESRNEFRARAGLTKRKNSRALIIASAMDVFRARGYVSADVDQISKQSGRSAATLFNHFSSKAQLGLAVLDEQFGGMSQEKNLTTLPENVAELDAGLNLYQGIGLALAEQKTVAGQTNGELLPKVFKSFLGAILLEQTNFKLRTDLHAVTIAEACIDFAVMSSLNPTKQESPFPLLLEGLRGDPQ